MDRAEPKKECPSCGLGVDLDANICEFCGWDFQEEDEWILQIEKLERDLIMEKQKFEPGTVNHMIETTLRDPVLERAEDAHSLETEAPEQERESVPTAEVLFEKEEPAPEPSPEPQPAAEERLEPARTEPRTRTVRAPPPEREPAAARPEEPPPVRRVRRVSSAAADAPSPSEDEEQPKRRTRTVRTVRKIKS